MKRHIRLVLVSAVLALSACEEEDTLPSFDPVELSIMAKVSDLRNTESEIRNQAMDALVQHGARAVPRIIPLLSEQNAALRNRAAQVLGRMGAEAKEAVPALVGRLKARDEAMVVSVLGAIGQIGEAAGEAVPELTAMIRDPRVHKETKRHVGRAIVNIGGPSVPALIEALEDDDPGYRYGAARALSRMGMDAEPARPALEKAKNDPDQKVRFWVRKTLSWLDGEKEKTARAASQPKGSASVPPQERLAR